MAKEERRQPELRFKGFTADWEQQKINDVALINPNTSVPDEFEYVDLESVVGTEMISYRTIKRIDAPSRAKRLAKIGDVFFQTVRPYQKNNYHFDLQNDNFVFSTGYAQLRPVGDSYFLFSRLQEDKFVLNVLNMCTGTSYPAINANDLGEIKIFFPKNLKEEIKIGSFLRNLDLLIALHQRKLDILKNIKKAFLQHMFPEKSQEFPKLRFNNFSELWEQRKLGKVSDITKLAGFEFTKYVKYSDRGEIIALRGLNVKNGNLILDDVKYIDESDFSKLNRSKLYKNDILFTYVGTVGQLALVPQNNKYHLAPNVARIRMNTDIDPVFISQQMGDSNYYNKVIFPLIATSSQPALSMENIRKFLVFLPNLEEQNTISSFFEVLDAIITLHQRKLDSLERLKASYLQLLFPQ
ncbi:restriction endonuclease subunit S [Ruoffia sp. FAM 26255]|uniref:restriction endonuclease subunit S n=1 Tax=Ruoffia sp. FAM 26255 TaxID=3259519 RepID=UPI00388A7FB2